MSATHKSTQMPHPLHRSLEVTISESNWASIGGNLPPPGTLYGDAAWKTYFGKDYIKEFSNYYFAWSASDGKDGGTILFVIDPPTTEEQATYNYEYQDGVNGIWPSLKQTFIFLRNTPSGSPHNGYIKGDAVPPPPAASGTGWVRSGEQEQEISDKRLASVFIVVDVHYTPTAQTRTEYDFNPVTGTLTTAVITWVSPSSVPTQSGNQTVTQKPVSSLWSLRTSSTISDPASYHLITPTSINLPPIPDILDSIDVIWSEAAGAGNSDSVATMSPGTGSVKGLSAKDNSKSNADASLTPELVIKIRQIWGRGISGKAYSFVLPNPATLTDILAKITALAGLPCSVWPVFHPRNDTIILSGGGVKVSAAVNGQCGGSAPSGASLSTYKVVGKQGSAEISLHVNAIRIPPTIHGIITIGGTTSDYRDATATAYINWPSAGPTFIGLSDSKIATGRINAAVTPTSLPATVPAAPPTSGLYMIEYNARQFQQLQGYVMVSAVVVDAADIA